MKILILVLGLLTTVSVFSQDIVNSKSTADFSDQKLNDIPSTHDDAETQTLLRTIAKKAGWFPEIKINVAQGIVAIDGLADDPDHLKWLTQTASRLPTVIAVVNRANVKATAVTDMTPFFKEIKRLQSVAKKNLPIVVVGLVMSAFFIFIGFYLQSWSKKLWARKIPNAFLAVTVAKLCLLPIWLMFFYITLLTVGMQSLAATIIGGTGVLGIVLGFAFKGIAENYLSGLLLAMRSPFTKGDSIKIGEFEGIVQNLNMRGTTIMDFDGNLVLIPNTTVIQSVVRNKTANSIKRSNFIVSIGYCESAQKAVELVREILSTHQSILQEPSFTVTADEIGAFGINLKVFYWFDAEKTSEATLKSQIIIKTKETLLSHGISLFDQTSVRIEMSKAEHKPSIVEIAQKNLREARPESSERNEDEDLKKVAERSSLPTHDGKENLLTQ